MHSVALIGLDSSIDWLCMPHLDSLSIFGSLLDDMKRGHFTISPADEWDSTVENHARKVSELVDINGLLNKIVHPTS